MTLADAPTASTTLVLTISDINDHSPQFYFGAYTGFVNENVEEGHIVISTVNAFDGDAVNCTIIIIIILYGHYVLYTSIVMCYTDILYYSNLPH